MGSVSGVSKQSREGGKGSLRALLFPSLGLILFGVVLAGVDALYRFYDLRNQIMYVLRSADLEPDMELRKKAVAVIKRAGIECAEQDIVLSRSGEVIKLELTYRHRIGSLLPERVKGLGSFPVRLTVEREVSAP
jgi:hypothetical protein